MQERAAVFLDQVFAEFDDLMRGFVSGAGSGEETALSQAGALAVSPAREAADLEVLRRFDPPSYRRWYRWRDDPFRAAVGDTRLLELIRELRQSDPGLGTALEPLERELGAEVQG